MLSKMSVQDWFEGLGTMRITSTFPKLISGALLMAPVAVAQGLEPGEARFGSFFADGGGVTEVELQVDPVSAIASVGSRR